MGFSLTLRKKDKGKRKLIEELKKTSREDWLEEETFNVLAKKLERSFEVPEGWTQIESYPLSGKYAFASVHILYKPEEDEYLYYVNEPKLNEEEYRLAEEIIDKLGYVVLKPERITGRSSEELLREEVDKILSDYRIELEGSDFFRVFYHVLKKTVLYDRITPLMLDPSIEDISCNGHEKPIYIFHRKYTNLKTNLVFESSDVLDAFVIKLAQRCGKHISVAEPMVDATMPDGSRIQMTLGREVTDHGSTFTVRKFRKEPITPVSLIKWGTFSAEQMAYLWLCIENRKSLIFAGGTASGKTTSTNAVALFIPRKAKIVTIEDTRELTLPHKNWIPGVTRDAFQENAKPIEMYDLLRAALRQRPEYIIVGEVRGKEAATLFQAMSTGHTTYSTLHADSVNSAIHRLENPPISVPRAMIEALDIISIQTQTYVNEKRVRRNVEIAEIVGLDPNTKMLRTSTVFIYDNIRDVHQMVGTSKALDEIKKMRGWSARELEDELRRRQYILEYMVENDITEFKKVSSVIYAYQAEPEEAFKLLEEYGGAGLEYM
ncbi:MAG: type II/IV secretion system ATPase subunit [Archaeoglobus sp.]|nr:type II/IV secretion system ATPase subunit [Archaeoglobus sp.]